MALFREKNMRRIISGHIFSQSASNSRLHHRGGGGRRAGSAGLLQTEREWGGLFVSSRRLTKPFKSKQKLFSADQLNLHHLSIVPFALFSPL